VTIVRCSRDETRVERAIRNGTEGAMRDGAFSLHVDARLDGNSTNPLSQFSPARSIWSSGGLLK
jgi:hypothetical protein